VKAKLSERQGTARRAKKTSGRRRDPEATRSDLLMTAKVVFNRDGYFATHSNAIAIEAGLAPGSFYTHFSDKLELFLIVYESWVEGEWAAIERVRASNGTASMAIGATVAAMAAHHRQWRIFRKNLRALSALESRVRTAQNDQRLLQIERLKNLCVSSGISCPSTSSCIVALLAVERTLDACAENDCRALKSTPRDVEASLSRALAAVLMG
jgi:AcrR family transcriptional regulator